MKKRNPYVKDLYSGGKYRTRVAKSGEEREEQRDGWSRKAKHKATTLDEALQHGDNVEIISGPLKKVLDRAEAIRRKEAGQEGEEEKSKKLSYKAVVKEPDGPANTVGISVDAEYDLVEEDDLKLICEAFDDLLEMRYIEVTAGVRIPVSLEEQEIFDKAAKKLYKSELDEREQEVARKMVSRGVINRRKDEQGGLYFVQNNKQLTRF